MRAGSGACGRGPPNPGLGRLSRNGFMPARVRRVAGRQAQRVARKSGAHGMGLSTTARPALRPGGSDWDLKGIARPQRAPIYPVRSSSTACGTRRTEIAVHVAPGDRFFGIRKRPLGARVPLGFPFPYALACGGDDARPQAQAEPQPLHGVRGAKVRAGRSGAIRENTRGWHYLSRRTRRHHPGHSVVPRPALKTSNRKQGGTHV